MPATASVSPTGNAYIDGILGNIKWATRNLTFSFPASASYYGSPYGYGENANGFEALNAQQKTAARAAFNLYAAVSNVRFSEIAESASQHGDLRLAESDLPGTAWAYFPSTAAEGGDAWFNNSSGAYDSPSRGNYAYTTFIHEIGHALGLEHPHQSGMPVDRDSMEYSVMSYRSYVGASTSAGYTNETWGYAQTLMMYDIAAIQHLYGANFSTNSGNTTYSWSPTSGEMSINGTGQGAAGGNRIFQTLWDGGGTDTYDFSNYTTNLSVDLRPGGWTTTSAAQLARLHYNGSQVADGNIANALQYNGDARSLIENATGGAGDDQLIGNDTANVLSGNGGNDRLIGGDGGDTLYGGAGIDTAVFAEYLNTYYIYVNNGAVTVKTAQFEENVCVDIEYFEFGDGVRSLSELPLATYGAGDIAWRNYATGEAGYWDMYQGSIGGWRSLGARDSGWQVLDIGDYTGDGNDDILWRNNSTGEVQYYDLSRGIPAQVRSFGNVSAAWVVESNYGASDFTNDGSDDILWRNASTGEVGYWETTNGFTSSWVSFGAISNAWRVEFTDDFLNDGSDDILWRNTSTGDFGFWDMFNGSISAWQGYGAIPLNWDVEATGDYTGDGFVDILWRDTNTGELGFWDMYYGQIQGWHGFGELPDYWQVQNTRDYTGDGEEDILWRNTNNGEIGYWDLEGGYISSWTGLATVSNDWYVI